MKGKKNKKFIDKKNATTFVVLNRGTDGADATEKVFHAVKPPNLPKGQKWTPQMTLDQGDSKDDQHNNSEEEDSRDEEERDYRAAGNFRVDDFALGEYGFPDDGYDYGQHFAPLGGGKWFAAAAMGQVTAANRAAKNSAATEPSLVAPPPTDVDFAAPKVVLVKENGRLLARDEQYADADSDEEVRRMLEESDSSEEGGDLADDFIVSAMQKGPVDEKDGASVSKGSAEPKEEPRKKLVSDRVRFADADFEDDDEEDESFHTSDEKDEADEERSHRSGNGVVQFEERVGSGMVDDWLDHLMEKEYDNEQLGEGPEALNHASSEHRGKVFANDLEDYFTEYLEVKNVPASTAYKNGEELGAEEREKTLLLARKVLEAREEVMVIETAVKDTQWDCESILSTYSNVANHPKVIDEAAGSSKKTRKPKPVAFADAAEAKVEEPDEASKGQAVNKGVARKKAETPDERKARKAAVKAERKAARETKKSLKMSYKAEAASQKNHVNAVPFYSQTVIPMNN